VRTLVVAVDKHGSRCRVCAANVVSIDDVEPG
jgi:hypothetical protein